MELADLFSKKSIRRFFKQAFWCLVENGRRKNEI